MEFVLNRDYALRTGAGHIVDFVKGKPTYVPKEMHKDALAIGAEAVGEKMHVLDDDPVIPVAPQGDERDAAVLGAIKKMIERDEAGDFTANGRPNVKRIEALVGFDITPEERDLLWVKYQSGE